jgi:ElaB/YqjD/DUF883 family membrane-anchored ribosome-binding protein
MGEETRTARQEVLAARASLSGEVDELGSAARSAVDIPAKVRKNPVQTVGVAAGAAFLAVGGPKRVLKAVERRVFPSRAQKAKGYLPKELARAIDSLGDDAAKAREHLESEFQEFLRRRAPEAKDVAKQVSGRQSFWKTYDAFVGPLGALGAKALAERLLAAEPRRKPGGGTEKPGDVTFGDLATAEVGKKITGSG